MAINKSPESQAIISRARVFSLMDLVTVRPSNAMTISDGIAVSGTKQQLCLYTGLPRACRDKGREEQRKKQYGFGIQKLHATSITFTHHLMNHHRWRVCMSHHFCSSVESGVLNARLLRVSSALSYGRGSCLAAIPLIRVSRNSTPHMRSVPRTNR